MKYFEAAGGYSNLICASQSTKKVQFKKQVQHFGASDKNVRFTICRKA
ncbi:MAG: hypothetical protein WA987_14710 [Cellvibrio sp.]